MFLPEYMMRIKIMVYMRTVDGLSDCDVLHYTNFEKFSFGASIGASASGMYLFFYTVAKGATTNSNRSIFFYLV